MNSAYIFLADHKLPNGSISSSIQFEKDETIIVDSTFWYQYPDDEDYHRLYIENSELEKASLLLKELIPDNIENYIDEEDKVDLDDVIDEKQKEFCKYIIAFYKKCENKENWPSCMLRDYFTSKDFKCGFSDEFQL